MGASFLERLDGLHRARRARQLADEARLGGLGAREGRARGVQDLVPGAKVRRRLAAQPAPDLRQGAGPERLLADAGDLGLRPGQLLEPDAVNLLGRERQRGVDLDEPRVAGRSAGHVRDPGVGLVPRAREDLPAQQDALPRERRARAARDRGVDS
jgi:hypothetical protein